MSRPLAKGRGWGGGQRRLPNQTTVGPDNIMGMWRWRREERRERGETSSSSSSSWRHFHPLWVLNKQPIYQTLSPSRLIPPLLACSLPGLFLPLYFHPSPPTLLPLSPHCLPLPLAMDSAAQRFPSCPVRLGNWKQIKSWNTTRSNPFAIKKKRKKRRSGRRTFSYPNVQHWKISSAAGSLDLRKNYSLKHLSK